MTIPLENRRIVLIGGAGFIGHNLALSLVQQKAKVDIIDGLQVNNLLHFAAGVGRSSPQHELYSRMLNQRLDLLRDAGVTVHPQDARDYNALSRILSEIRPQAIVHLAAIAHAGTANKDPFST